MHSCTYSAINVGQCFSVSKFRGAPVYMKISSEKDHNHDYVTVSKVGRGNVHPALEDGTEVYPVEISIGA